MSVHFSASQLLLVASAMQEYSINSEQPASEVLDVLGCLDILKIGYSDYMADKHRLSELRGDAYALQQALAVYKRYSELKHPVLPASA
uniref:Uncharacterized protein n=1 Tax=Leviviridae sp. TaxID=2027243 RepID=A0A514DAP4_9VIRU|nr:MAG: hypothetical protein H4Bulk46484e3101_000002 [Leviviridae sp.]